MESDYKSSAYDSATSSPRRNLNPYTILPEAFTQYDFSFKVIVVGNAGNFYKIIQFIIVYN